MAPMINEPALTLAAPAENVLIAGAATLEVAEVTTETPGAEVVGAVVGATEV